MTRLTAPRRLRLGLGLGRAALSLPTGVGSGSSLEVKCGQAGRARRRRRSLTQLAPGVPSASLALESPPPGQRKASAPPGRPQQRQRLPSVASG